MIWAKLVQRFPLHAGKLIAWSSIVLLTRMTSFPLRFSNANVDRLTALCFNFAGIMAARFFLGVVESIIGPVFVIVTGNWWTRREQAFRTAFWLSGTPVSLMTFLS